MKKIPYALSIAAAAGVYAADFFLLGVPAFRNGWWTMAFFTLPGALLMLGPRGAGPIRAWAWAVFWAALAGYPALRLWAYRLPQDPPAVAAGDRAPDFALPDAQGRTVSLASLVRDGRVLLVFFRGPG
ncbi:MAG: hypothetical protein ACK44W_14915 [Planctomycetota bacterium]